MSHFFRYKSGLLIRKTPCSYSGFSANTLSNYVSILHQQASRQPLVHDWWERFGGGGSCAIVSCLFAIGPEGHGCFTLMGL